MRTSGIKTEKGIRAFLFVASRKFTSYDELAGHLGLTRRCVRPYVLAMKRCLPLQIARETDRPGGKTLYCYFTTDWRKKHGFL